MVNLFAFAGKRGFQDAPIFKTPAKRCLSGKNGWKERKQGFFTEQQDQMRDFDAIMLEKEKEEPSP
jgi:hypothetical protein